MIKYSTGLREAIAVGSSLRAALNSGLIKIYSGTVPASADAAIGGATLLCTVSAGGGGTPVTFNPTAPGGVLSKTTAENWTGNNVAGGTPTFFRYVLAADDGSASSSAVRFQGSAGVLGSDMFISTIPMVDAAPQSFQLFQIAVPEQ